MNPVTAAVYLKEPLDFETAQTHTVTVQVADEGITPQKMSTATLTINVLNTNDNKPVSQILTLTLRRLMFLKHPVGIPLYAIIFALKKYFSITCRSKKGKDNSFYVLYRFVRQCILPLLYQRTVLLIVNSRILFVVTEIPGHWPTLSPTVNKKIHV